MLFLTSCVSFMVDSLSSFMCASPLKTV
jgi:hypothetical protein